MRRIVGYIIQIYCFNFSLSVAMTSLEDLMLVMMVLSARPLLQLVVLGINSFVYG